MVDYEKVGIGFILLFIGIVIYSGLNNDKFVDSIANGTFWESLGYYAITRVDYIFIIFFLVMSHLSTTIKEIFAGLTLIFAIDILSFPRMPVSGLPTDISFMANSDYLFMSKLLEITKLQYDIAWKFYYIVLPIILILIVGYLLGFHRLGRRIAA